MGATDKLEAKKWDPDVITTAATLSTRVGTCQSGSGSARIGKRRAGSADRGRVISLSCAPVTHPEMLLTSDPGDARPLWLVTEADLPRWLNEQPVETAAWVRANGFQGERHRVLTLPSAAGQIAAAVVGLGSLRAAADLKLWHVAGLSDRLPALAYRLATTLPAEAATHFAVRRVRSSFEECCPCFLSARRRSPHSRAWR